MEQFELRFIVCGSDLAATNGCAKILFEAPLPGKVTLRQDGKFLFGTVTIGYAGAASPDWQVALTSDLLTEIQFRERVESVLSKLGLPYCIFEGTEINPRQPAGRDGPGAGRRTAVPKHLADGADRQILLETRPLPGAGRMP